MIKIGILLVLFMIALLVILHFAGSGSLILTVNEETGSPVYEFKIDDLDQIEKKKLFILYIKRTKNKG